MIELFLATFLFCAVWILSVYITQKICDMDPEIRAINTRVLTVKILDYIEYDTYNKAKVDIDTVEYELIDENKSYVTEFRDNIGKYVRVTIESKIEGIVIIHPAYYVTKAPQKIYNGASNIWN